MGSVLDAAGRRAEARPYYESALQQALNIQPDFQIWMVPSSNSALRHPMTLKTRIRDQYPSYSILVELLADIGRKVRAYEQRLRSI